MTDDYIKLRDKKKDCVINMEGRSTRELKSERTNSFI